MCRWITERWRTTKCTGRSHEKCRSAVWLVCQLGLLFFGGVFVTVVFFCCVFTFCFARRNGIQPICCASGSTSRILSKLKKAGSWHRRKVVPRPLTISSMPLPRIRPTQPRALSFSPSTHHFQRIFFLQC